MSNLTYLTLAEARDKLKSRAISSAEITRAHLEAIERARALNAFVAETAEKALAMAGESDARLARGEGGPLEGLPIGVKDLYATKGVHTQACSHILDGFKPTYESTVTANLWRDGAVMLGKLNMDEFAMGSSNETSYYGPVASPWMPPNWSRDQARAALGADKRGLLTPGGSSGGSAAAVAARLCLAATASDTGGSIRQPAAFTGTSASSRLTDAARATEWSRSRRRSIRPARSREPCATPRSCCGRWPERTTRTSTCARSPVPDYEAAIGKSIKGLTIGIPREYRLDGMNAEIEALWARGADWLRAAGARVVDVSLPNTRHALPAYYIVAPAEASSNLARYDGVRYGLREAVVRYRRSLQEDARQGFRRGSAASVDDRHLCVVGRLLRRLLRQGAKDPHPHPARLRARVRRRRRRHPHPGDAFGGVRDRRKRLGRSGRDVPQRRVHGDRQHGRTSGTGCAGRALGRGPAARLAAHRAPRSTKRRCSPSARSSSRPPDARLCRTLGGPNALASARGDTS